MLAEQYFGDQTAMIRLDMSEYMERHTVAKLIGAPPGVCAKCSRSIGQGSHEIAGEF